MKKSLKVTLLSLCGIVAVLLAAVLVFVGIYFTRIQTMNSIEKLSDYDDGYNLYRMRSNTITALTTLSTTASRTIRR